MPNSLLSADTMFPNFRDGQGTDAKIDEITNYLYMLLEQLRYTLANLGQENFNATELDGIANWITDPVFVKLEGVEGEMATIGVSLDGLYTRVTDAEGNISVLTQTAEGLTSRMTDAEGNISVLTQSATTLGTRITNAEGSISTLTQSVDSITLNVANGTTSSVISLSKDGAVVSSQQIVMSGLVTFASLQTSGATIINGDNISTGKISAITLQACQMDCTLLSGQSESDGKISFYYMVPGDENLLAGRIYLDNQGAGTTAENAYRLVMRTYTTRFGSSTFALKLISAGALSMEASDMLYGKSGVNVTMEAPIHSYKVPKADGSFYANLSIGTMTFGDTLLGTVTIDAPYAWVNGNLIVQQACLINGDLSVSGSATITGTLTVNGRVIA